MVNQFVLAKLIIEETERRDIEVSNLKLQKLAFFCQVVSFILNDRRILIEENAFQAWQYGPVLPDLYYALKGHSSNPISLSFVRNLAESSTNEANSLIDVNDGNAISETINHFGDRSALDLVNLTHEKDSPWDLVWKNTISKSNMILDQSISDFYS